MKKKDHTINYILCVLLAFGTVSLSCAQNTETDILQSAYIPQPSLWLGPTLWESGFVVEVEVSSLGLIVIMQRR